MWLFAVIVSAGIGYNVVRAADSMKSQIDKMAAELPADGRKGKVEEWKKQFGNNVPPPPNEEQMEAFMKMGKANALQYMNSVREAIPTVTEMNATTKAKLGKYFEGFKNNKSFTSAQKSELASIGAKIKDGTFQPSETNNILSQLSSNLKYNLSNITSDQREVLAGLKTQLLGKMRSKLGTGKALGKDQCPGTLSKENLKLLTLGSWSESERAFSERRMRLNEDRALMMCQLQYQADKISRVADKGSVRLAARLDQMKAKLRTAVDEAGEITIEMPDQIPEQFKNGIDLSAAITNRDNLTAEMKKKLKSALVSVEAFPKQSVEMLRVEKLASPIKIDFKMAKADCDKVKGAFIDHLDPAATLVVDNSMKVEYVNGNCRLNTDHLTDFALVDSSTPSTTEVTGYRGLPNKKKAEKKGGENGRKEGKNAAPAYLGSIPLLLILLKMIF